MAYKISADGKSKVKKAFDWQATEHWRTQLQTESHWQKTQESGNVVLSKGVLNNHFPACINTVQTQTWKKVSSHESTLPQTHTKGNDFSFVKRHQELPFTWFSRVKKDLFSELVDYTSSSIGGPVSIITDVSASPSLPVSLSLWRSTLPEWLHSFKHNTKQRMFFFMRLCIKLFIHTNGMWSGVALESERMSCWFHNVLATAECNLQMGLIIFTWPKRLSSKSFNIVIDNIK